ncbi:MAG: SH3 domain-containing protein [Clostridia bacterium]|nr:SH3 domain-containing protein [Clostridia bacterium]
MTKKFTRTLAILLVLLSLLSMMSTALAATEMYVTNCQEYVTLRKTPSKQGHSVCKVPLAARVTYLGYGDTSEFYHVTYNGKEGYILKQYLAVTSYSTYTGATMRVVNCNEYVTLRKTPSKQGHSAAKVPLNATVSYYGYGDTAEFYHVNYNGTEGYILRQYLAIVSNSSSSSASSVSTTEYTAMRVYNCNEYVSLRKSPSTSANRLQKVYYGQFVTVLNRNVGNGFYYCDFNGTKGYILAQYLTPDISKLYNGADMHNYNMRVAYCQSYITLRTAPITSAPEITKVPLNSIVRVVYDNTGDEFYYVYYNGMYGYVLSKYLAY